MALDGAFLRHIKTEIEDKIIGGRVEKIHQPNRDELVFAIRTREAAYKLLLSARANSARVNFIEVNPENPKQPPMLCMLLRKKLQSARVTAVTQPGLERVLKFSFDAVNELGDRVVLDLYVEIMGKYSNIVLADETGRIVDALKRVDTEMSSLRLVLPGMQYELPPPQDKLNLLETPSQMFVERVKGIPKNTELAKAVLSVLQGVSPIVCRELQHQVGRGKELFTKEMDEEQYFRLGFFYQKLKDTVTGTDGKPAGKPYMVVDKRKKPADFSFLAITQYGIQAEVREKESFSDLLNSFYHDRDAVERMRVKEQDLLKHLASFSERLTRKINIQKAELESCRDRDYLRIYGDLINANVHLIEPGRTSVELQNFYDEALPVVKIELSPLLSAQQNAQKYYKEYKKAKTAEQKLLEQIAIAGDELEYIQTVFDALTRAENEKELNEIKAELAEQGYIKSVKNKRNKAPAISEPQKFITADGFTVLVGKNNRQNDKLTMKMARNHDMWFHTKDIPGSHTVLLTEGKEPSESAMEFAATLAAKHSRAKDSAQVPVDYTRIKNVSKPQGAKPGMVIYVNYKTMYVDPTAEITGTAE